MEAYKMMSFLIAVGWRAVKNGFAVFLENRSMGAVEYNHPNVTSGSGGSKTFNSKKAGCCSKEELLRMCLFVHSCKCPLLASVREKDNSWSEPL